VGKQAACYTQAMKNITDTKKTTSKAKETKVKNYRFWLVLSCVGLAVVWCVLLVALLLLGSALILSLAGDTSYSVYNPLMLLATYIALFLASALSLLFASAVFKRLKIHKPLISATAFFTALVFGVTLFTFVTGLWYSGSAAIWGILAACMIFAGLLYGAIARPLKHKLSTAQFLVVTIGLAVLPLVVYTLWRLLVIKSF